MKRTALDRSRAIGWVGAWFLGCLWATANELTIRRWTSDEGLPQSRISALAQTPDGYLWCGTWFGLARFDGVRFLVFDRDRVPAFRHSAVNALAVDRVDGALWVGTRDGLLRFHEGQWQRFGAEQGLPGRIIWRLLPRQAGGVWLDTDWQVAVVTAGGPRWVSPQLVEAGILPKGDTIRQLVAEVDDQLTFVTDSGLKSLRLGAEAVDSLQPAAVADPPWRAVLLDGVGRLEYLGTRHGLARLRGEERTWLVEASPGGLEETVLLHRDATGATWGAPNDRGLGRIREGVWESVPLLPGRPPTDLTCALDDREGGLWLGTSDGLFRVQAAAARTYTTRDGLPDEDVWSIHESRTGDLWIGTGRGLARLQGGRFTRLDPGSCRSVWAGLPGPVWASVGNLGVGREEDGRFVPWISPAALGDSDVDCLYGDRSGRLWIGSARGAFVWADQRLQPWPLKLENPADPPAVKTVLEDRLGRLWFGTERHGLLGWHRGLLRRYTRQDGLAGDAVWALHEDETGVLWLGGERGLTRFVPPGAPGDGSPTDGAPPSGGGSPGSRPAAFAFGPSHGLPAEEINQVLEDDFGQLWLGTLRGVLRVRRAALGAVAAGQAERAAVAVFGTADGMESSETNGEHQPAGCRTRDGRIWFPTTRGVAVFDPRTLPRDEAAPAVVIEEVSLEGVAVAWRRESSGSRRAGQGSARPSDDRSPTGPLATGGARLMRFRYTAPTFVSAERARFRHRLRGLDDAWHEAGEERVAYFTNLEPGAYAFEVAGCNAHGVWQEKPATFAFSLAPSFTQTAWYPVFLAFGGIALAGAFLTWRLRWQRRSLRAEQAATMSGERARIAQDLHDDLGTALTGVALELDVLRRDTGSSPVTADRLAAASGRVRALAARMREVVWAVNPRCDTVPSLAGFLEQQAGPLLAPAGITPRFDFPDEIPVLPMEADTRHQLALAVRELLVNIVRHSRATEAGLGLQVGGGWLRVEISDNGRGFDPRAVGGRGHGLVNVPERLARLGGTCDVRSEPGRGTRVTLRVPLPDGAERKS